MAQMRLVRTWAEAISSAFVVAAVTVSCKSIWGHLRRNKHPHLRKYTIRILLMVPVYALEAWLALRWVQQAHILQLMREVYEAFVIFSFMQFVLCYLGGPRELAETLEAEAHAPEDSYWRSNTNHLVPCCCLGQWSGSRFVRRSLLGVLQYVPLQLLGAACAMAAWLAGRFHPGTFSLSDAWPWLLVLRNGSQMWALYCLVLFYRATKERMRGIRPLAKFLCIKCIIFFTFWQALALTLLQRAHFGAVVRLNQRLSGAELTGAERRALHRAWHRGELRDEIGTAAQNLLLCIEMLGFALLHAHAYPSDEFGAARVAQMSTGPPTPSASGRAGLWDIIDAASEIRDVRGVGSPLSRRGADLAAVAGLEAVAEAEAEGASWDNVGGGEEEDALMP
eukprot:g2131.t1